MDIEYLLFLQGLREATGGVLDGFFSFVTTLGEAPLILLMMCALYLGVSKALGTYVLMGWSLNRLANGLIKTTACVYRPWVRDPRVQPLESAFAKATGYSFPSGHTTNAVSIFGGPALRRGTNRAVRVGLLVTILLVGLSRNWLGVHTPQDVLVAMAVGVVLMLAAQRVCDMLEERPERDVLVAAIGVALCVASAAYAALKSYPIEYTATGELLVDPAKMANDSYKNAGWALGFFVGWLAERRLVGFSPEKGTVQQRVSWVVWGSLGVLVMYYPVSELVKMAIPGIVGTLLSHALQTLFITLVMPALATLVARRAIRRISAA
jgi:membrane-associated phospholipid phosphatase